MIGTFLTTVGGVIAGVVIDYVFERLAVDQINVLTEGFAGLHYDDILAIILPLVGGYFVKGKVGSLLMIAGITVAGLELFEVIHSIGGYGLSA